MTPRFLLVFFLLTSSLLSYSQVDDQLAAYKKGNLVINYNLGFGAYGSTYEFPDSRPNYEGGHFSGQQAIKVEYGIGRKLSIGLHLISGAGNSDEDKQNIGRESQWREVYLAPAIQYHFIRDHRTDLFLNLSIGIKGLEYEETNLVYGKSEGTLGGGGWRLGLGARFYFAQNRRWSFNMNMGLAGYNHEWQEFIVNNDILDNPKGSFSFGGFETSIGLGFKILR